MKFLESERKDVLKAIEESGLAIEQFTFIKRKGRMHIQHPQQEDFVYFRRKAASLVNGNQFERSSTYELQMSGQTIPMDNWQDVVQVFRAWLTKLNT